jgi:PhoPQ-activated pathogenicity-related protein
MTSRGPLTFLALLVAPLPYVWADDAPSTIGALDQYVDRPDSSYRWEVRRTGMVGETEYVELTLTSQTWRDITWRHQLYILKPAEVAQPVRGVFVIAGGRWSDALAEPPADPNADLPKEASYLSAAAVQMKSPVVILKHVPFQPVFDGMVEDEIISYTFEQFYKTQEADWPLLLPMVKSAVRGMDAAQEYCREKWQLEVPAFTVTGGSKRGWTTWLTGAVDPRASAIAPMVIDVLNMAPQMKHQVDTWGRYSEQIEDYTRRGLQDYADTDLGRRLNAIVDPYSYRDRLTQPKFIMNGTNDRYWTLDALNLYWDGLKGDKYVMYVPNQGHGLNDLVRVIGSLNAFHQSAAGRLELPRMSWTLEPNGIHLHLVVKSDHPPKQVLAWSTTSPTKDFREARWTSSATEQAEQAYHYRMPIPSSGYAALFGEAVFEAGGVPYFLSTNVRIVNPKDAAAGGR